MTPFLGGQADPAAAQLLPRREARNSVRQATRLGNIVTLSRSDTKLKEQLIDLAGQSERLAERAVGLQRPAGGRQFGRESRL